MYSVSARAADFDTLLSAEIKSSGIFDGKTGVFYAAEVDNNTMLTVVSATADAFIIKLYDSDGEPADTLTIEYKPGLTLSVSDADSFYVLEDKRVYKLVNDAFTISDVKPGAHTKLAELKGKTVSVSQPVDKVYNFLNKLREKRISRLPAYNLPEHDASALLRLIKSCADIQDYDSEGYDIDSLMRSVLYTHRNFMLLTPEDAGTGTVSRTLRICRESFITEAMYAAFRIKANRPAVNMLTELGYCVNNGYYYYSGGYSQYFATDVAGIVKAVPIADNRVYIVFKDSYTSGGSKPVNEYSTATALRDSDGWYLTAIHMNSNFDDLPWLTGINAEPEAVAVPLPETAMEVILILLLAFAAVGFIIYFVMLR